VEAPPRRGVTTGRDLSQRSKWVAGRPVLEVTGRGLSPVGYRGARPDARQRCAEGASDSRLAATRHLVGTAQNTILPAPYASRRRHFLLSCESRAPCHGTQCRRSVITRSAAWVSAEALDVGSISAAAIKPLVRIFGRGCCARAASGHAAASPSSVMNWCRLRSRMGSTYEPRVASSSSPLSSASRLTTGARG
jgi:hypothetical protein